MIRPELILIGYWSAEPRNESAPDDRWPRASDLVDFSWDADERDDVADYLGRGFAVRAYMGYSPCRFCGRDNGCLELSDGTYVWPEGLPHYLVEHGVRLPARFVTHVLGMVEAFEDAGRDESWWRGLQGP